MFGLIILALWILLIITGFILYKNTNNNIILKICNKYNRLQTTKDNLPISKPVTFKIKPDDDSNQMHPQLQDQIKKNQIDINIGKPKMKEKKKKFRSIDIKISNVNTSNLSDTIIK